MDFAGKLLACVGDAGTMATKMATLPHQTELLKGLNKAHEDMKQSYHNIINKVNDVKAHGRTVMVEDVSGVMGKAIEAVKTFRPLESQAKPLTKDVSKKRARLKP